MEKAWAWAKEHPALAILIAVAVLVLLWLMFFRSSSQASSSGSSDLAAYYAAQAAMTQSGNALAAAQAGYAKDLGIAGIAGDVAKHNADAALQAAQIGAGVATTEAQLKASTDAAAIAASQQVSDAQIAAALSLGLNTNATGLQEAQINADAATTAANIAAGVTEQQQTFAYELGSQNIAASEATTLGAQQVQEAQIASDTTLGTLTAQNAALEAGYNYNLGVVQSNNATAADIAANADALSAAIAATSAATQQQLDKENTALALAGLGAAVATGGQVTTIGPQGDYTQTVINTGGYTPAMNAAVSTAFVKQTLQGAGIG